MITIYQNRCKELSSEPQKEAKYAMMMGAKNWQPEFAQYYVAAYEVNTGNLDEAFERTNLWNAMNKINFLVDRGPSSSVGDIFVVAGQCFIVDDMGFKQIANPFEV